MLKQFIEKLFTPKPSYEDLEQSVKALKSDLAQEIRRSVEKGNEISVLRSEATGSQKEIGWLKSEIERLKNQRPSVKQEMLAELKRATASLRDELTDSELRREELEKALADSTATNNTLSATIRELCAGKVVSNG